MKVKTRESHMKSKWIPKFNVGDIVLLDDHKAPVVAILGYKPSTNEYVICYMEYYMLSNEGDDLEISGSYEDAYDTLPEDECGICKFGKLDDGVLKTLQYNCEDYSEIDDITFDKPL